MHLDQMANALTEDLYYTIGVVFYVNGDGCFYAPDHDAAGYNKSNWSDQVYTYKVDKATTIQLHDYVAVKVGNELKIVRVVEVNSDDEGIDYESTIEYKYIVGKVDPTGDQKFTKRDKEILVKLREISKRRKKEQALQALTEELGGVEEVKKLLDGVQGITYDKDV